MNWRIEITEKDESVDALGRSICRDIQDLSFSAVRDVRVTGIYLISGKISEEDINRVASVLLTDSVTQTYQCRSQNGKLPVPESGDFHDVEIAYNPGVMDPVEESTLKGIRDLGIADVQAVRTARRYRIYGSLKDSQIKLIIEKVLSNKLIQHEVRTSESAVIKPASHADDFKVAEVDMLKASAKQLKDISAKNQLYLNVDEMKTIQSYFKKIKRNPTDAELETIAQTWSEHCHHKTFRGNIQLTVKDGAKTTSKTIRNLLKSTIVKATTTLNKSWCVSVFHDNAGVIKFDNETNLCFKVETHNHPSALEPFGGANTGVGGVIRDTLGTGLGAKPVCNTDVFCFAPPDIDVKDLPAGTLHPKRVMKGVVSGVRDYGNKMGIPTVNGSIIFDEKFVGNPLVFCGNIGLIPKGMDKKKVYKGNVIVVAGGKTGRDGIHGATFSSGELTDESEVVSSGAVQIGDPIQEKKVQDVQLQARDQRLYCAITDCGAGGLSSAVGEMGEHTGARVDLDKVPLKYDGLNYHEIWISESQERMVMAVPPAKVEALLDLFASENVEATVIGTFTGTGRLELYFKGVSVCDLDMEFLHNGIPRITKSAVWKAPAAILTKEPKAAVDENLTDSLHEVMSHLNVCSKEWVVRQYDHEVQGGSVVKPFVGVNCDGPSDAAVITPRLGSNKGFAVANGINVRYGMLDPYRMAVSCIDEAIRQVVAVGADPERIALLDNFCWGNPDKPDRLGGLVRAAEGCYKAAVAFGAPFISGKDSLYNEFADKGKSIAIPGTILISSIGLVNDVRKAVTMDLKTPGNQLYIIGETRDELGGSVYLDTLGYLGATAPDVNLSQAVIINQAVHQAIKKGYLRSVHDCSDGGIGVSLAEMAFAGGYGVTARLDLIPYKGKSARTDYALFSESNSRYIVEVLSNKTQAFEKIFKSLPVARMGQVEESPEFVIYGLQQEVCVNTTIASLKTAWQQPLNW